MSQVDLWKTMMALGTSIVWPAVRSQSMSCVGKELQNMGAEQNSPSGFTFTQRVPSRYQQRCLHPIDAPLSAPPATTSSLAMGLFSTAAAALDPPASDVLSRPPVRLTAAPRSHEVLQAVRGGLTEGCESGWENQGLGLQRTHQAHTKGAEDHRDHLRAASPMRGTAEGGRLL